MLLNSYLDSPVSYMVPQEWYLKYQRYKQGGPSPGEIDLSPLLSPSGDPLPRLVENRDFTIIPSHQWLFFTRTFGSTGEAIFPKKRFLFRSVSNGAYGDETLRSAVKDIVMPVSARKNVDMSSWKSSEGSKLASNGSDSSGHCKTQASSKLGFERTSNSHALNASLQLLVCVNGLLDYFASSAHSGELSNNEFLLAIAMVALTVSYTHRGVVKTEFLIRMCFSREISPGIIIENIINKIELECPSQAVFENSFNGVLKVETKCLICSCVDTYQSKFSFLSLQPSKSLEKSMEMFTKERMKLAFCNVCLKERHSEQHTTISVLPNFLVVIFKRWEEKNREKSECSFKRKLKTGDDYRLVAVIAEVKSKFVCFAKRNKTWYCYDDDKYAKTSVKAALATSPSVLLYKRRL
jgi:hypothetical protein